MTRQILAWTGVGVLAAWLYGPDVMPGVSAQTRFYLPSSSTTTIAPSVTSVWSHTVGVALERREMRIEATSTELALLAYSPDAADHLTSGSSLFVQFYSASALAAQTIPSQLVDMSIQGSETNGGNNVSLTARLFVVSGGGTTIRGQLFAQVKALTELSTTNFSNRLFQTTTELTVQQGDRLVFEVGIAGVPTAAGGLQGHNGRLRFGDPDGDTDLPETETESGLGFRPWIELANTLTFETAGAATSVVAKRLLLLGVG